MIELYPQIKVVHIASVLTSGAIFFSRAVGVQLGAGWVMTARLRYLSYSVDTVLLASALLLMTMLHQYPFVHSWLTVKVLFVVVYIVLGTFALRRGRTRAVRAACAIVALLVYAFILSTALTHDPLGVLGPIMS